MLQFLVDEDLPRSLARALRAIGFEAADVRDVGLRGADDGTVFTRAVEQHRLLLSRDLGFGISCGSRSDRIPASAWSDIPTTLRPPPSSKAVIEAVQRVDEMEMHGGLMIIEPGRVRLRRAR